MKLPRNRTVFAVAFLLGLSMILGASAWNRRPSPEVPVPLASRPLVEGVAVSAQIDLATVAGVRQQGFLTLVDLRPDGEAPDQPAAAAVASAARDNGLNFAYVPVPHGDVPEQAVRQLAEVLASRPQPILLYCRSGRRAVRTWSLAEASRPQGLSATEIQAAAARAGQPVDEISGEIARRIAARPGGKER